MPELPEVETVRRGLAPVMEGARFARVEARRRDLRWPLPKDFAARLEGQTVEGLGRRAKYLLADLSSGDVLLMHLGMSGSFRVVRGRQRERRPGAYYHERSRGADARSRGVPHVVGRANHVQRSAPVRVDEDRAARADGSGAVAARARSGAARQRIRRRHAGARLPRQEDLAQGRAAGSEGRRRARQHLRLRGAASRPAVAPAARFDPRDASGAPHERAERLVDAIRAVLNDAIKAGGSSLRDHRQASGELGLFQHKFRVYDREGEPCPTAGCRGIIRRIVQTGRSTFFCPVCQR